jgi:hypothetical protein
MTVTKLLLTLTSLLLIRLAVSADPCKIYPRIIGSYYGFARIFSIDANLAADRLVAVGDTNDIYLIGIGNYVSLAVPYIVMYSIDS